MKLIGKIVLMISLLNLGACSTKKERPQTNPNPPMINEEPPSPAPAEATANPEPEPVVKKATTKKTKSGKPKKKSQHHKGSSFEE